jgi:Protein of unknown function (DUF2878)
MSLLLNVAQFQIGWFACVLGAAHDRALLGSGVALLLTAIHLAHSAQRKSELSLIALAALIGIGADTLLAWRGQVSFSSAAPFAGVAPHWMAALWMMFATTLHHSLAWLKERLALAAALGALAGPLAYYAGERLGAIEATQPYAYVGIAVEWALALPFLLWAANRLQRPAALAPAPQL